MTDERKIFINEELDYTCIELLESDGTIDNFKIDPNIYIYNNNEILKGNDIFISQFPKGNETSFLSGIILDYEDNKIIHNTTTENGSLGSPLTRRCKDNYIIGLHFGGYKDDDNKYLFNLATPFNIILDDIKEELNEINCIYIWDENEIQFLLLHLLLNQIHYYSFINKIMF